jgi:mannose/cellobiose epimerase-like protein (N-acyl-D-glucosamine 2-epimerase family)
MTKIEGATATHQPESKDPESADIVNVLRTFIIEQSLPLWSREGWDHSNGGFVERLGKAGAPDYACARRVRVQARQIYCFAKAAQLGWYPKGSEVAMRGLDYLLAKAKSPDGRPGYVHLLDSDGSVINSMRDAYDHAFVLLALSTVFELNQDAQVRAEIESLLVFLDRDLRSPQGGFVEGIPPTLPRRNCTISSLPNYTTPKTRFLQRISNRIGQG